MILLTALIIILFEAIAEGLVKRHCEKLSDIIFKGWVQLLILVILFLTWIAIAVRIDSYYPVIKIVVGYVLLRYALFDAVFNISAGLGINHIGTTKLYDKILSWIRDMWGMGTIWFTRAIALFWGVAWLLKYKQ